MKYLPLVKHIIKKAEKEEMSYTARIIIRDRRDIKIHVSVPVDLYIKFLSKVDHATIEYG